MHPIRHTQQDDCVRLHIKKVEMQQQHIVCERRAIKQGRETYLDATLVIVLQR